MSDIVLSLRNITAGHGMPILKGLDLNIHAGDKLCLVGRNGCGKSTLLSVIQGTLPLDNGERFTIPGLTVASLPQDPVAPTTGTALDFALQSGAEKHRAEIFLHELGIAGDMPANALSGGQIRRVSLAGALALQPSILLLDEPTNHLDLPTIEWLESEINAYNGAILTISHDRTFLEKASQGVIWLEHGTIRRLDKSFAHFDDWVDEIVQADNARAQKLKHHIKAEERYLLRGVTARRTRNQKRLEKLDSLRQERAERHRMANANRVATIASQNSDMSSKMVFEVIDLVKHYGDKKLVNHLNMRVLRGDRLGVLGANGTGKSTLIKMMLGQIKPDQGNVRVAKNLEIGWFDQHREQLNPKKTPWDIIGDGSDYITVQGKQIHVMGYLKRFMFTEEDIRSQISILSGGQKNRLMLAKILAKRVNVLVLDEPTNDLDMDTLDMLQDMLMEYDGTLIVVSHDRDFLDKVVTSTLVLNGGGDIQEYVGGYSDYLAQIKSQKQADNHAKKQAKQSPTKTPDTPKAQQKLSYKDQRDLDTLPDKINELESSIAKLEEILADPTLYQTNPDLYTDVAGSLDVAKSALDTAENRWLELEILQDSLAPKMD